MSPKNSPDTRTLIQRKRLGRWLMLLGAFPVVLMVLAIGILVLIGCGFDEGPSYCDWGNPIVDMLNALVMFGMYGVFTLPVLLAGRIIESRAGRAYGSAEETEKDSE